MSGKEITDDYTKEIDSRVEKLRKDRDWRASHMTLEMALDEEREAGREEGKAEAIFGLVRDHLLSASDGATRLSMTESEFMRKMTKA